MHEHENQLIQLVRDGDLSAWGELIQIHQDRLYNSIVRVVGHPDQARDVVQDAFIQAIEKLDQLQQAGSYVSGEMRSAAASANGGGGLWQGDRGTARLCVEAWENLVHTHRATGARPKGVAAYRELLRLRPEHAPRVESEDWIEGR